MKKKKQSQQRLLKKDGLAFIDQAENSSPNTSVNASAITTRDYPAYNAPRSDRGSAIMQEEPAIRLGARRLWERFTWTLILVFSLAIGILWIADLRMSYESPRLLIASHFFFSALIPLFIVLLISRSFLLQRTPKLLFLGCGLIFWGAGGMVGSSLVWEDFNIPVTVHNTCVWLSGLCHLVGVYVSHRSQRTVRSGAVVMSAAYLGVLVLVAVITMATKNGWTPRFFVQGQGGTILRQSMLGAAIAMFTFTAFLLRTTIQKFLSSFRSWYSFSLAFVSVGLFGIMLQPTGGSLMGWTGRVAQYLGSLYMFMAAVAAIKQNGRWSISLEEALCQSEERFRTLAAATFEGIVIMDNGIIIEANEQFARMHGYELPEVIGKPITQFLSPDAAARIAQRIEKSDVQAHECRNVRKDGTVITVEARSRTASLQGRQVRITVIRDITERKQAEEAFREIGTSLARAQAIAHMGSWKLDLESHSSTCSEECYRILGITQPKGYTTRDFETCVHPDDLHIPYAFNAESIKIGKYLPHDFRIVRPDGEVRYVHVEGEFGSESGRKILYGTLQDITDRKKLEEDLRNSEKHFRTLADNSPDMIVRFSKDMRYLYLNPAALKVYDKTIADYLGRTVAEMVSGRKNVETIVSAVREVVETGTVKQVEMIIEKETVPLFLHIIYVPEFSDSGKVESVLSITRNVTQLKNAYAELKKSQEKIGHIIDNISDGFFAVDRQWRFTFMNKRSLVYSGKNPDTLIGKNLWEVFSSLKGTELEQAYRRAMDERVPVTIEHENKLTPGTWAQVNVYPSDEGLSVFWIDITDKKNMEEMLKRDKNTLEQIVNTRTRELMRAHEELERARRMTDVGRFSATIAHELRTPLAAMKLAAYNIARKAGSPAIEKHIETINKKIEQSDQIIQNLLSFTRTRPADYQPLYLVELLRDCMAAIAGKYASQDVHVKENFRCREEATIDADLTQLRMVFCNILDNAYQSCQENAGVLLISVELLQEGTYTISITDNGVGIGEGDIQQVFEPFYTTRTKGTGLGLTVSREIVEAHQGKVFLCSEKGKGTTVTVTLPCRQPVHTAVQPALQA